MPSHRFRVGGQRLSEEGKPPAFGNFPALFTGDRAAAGGPSIRQGARVQTLDEMLGRKLLTPDQHSQIRAWIAHARTPEAIRQMPASLWRTLELASVLMNLDADLTQPPSWSEGL